MATVFEVWGFGKIVAAGPDSGINYIDRLSKAMNTQAAARGIAAHVPSDALDMSRDVILDECGADEWRIEQGTLYATFGGLSVDELIKKHRDPFQS
ncbi:hypothetical protein [Mycobacteroides abscessus]|uniref:hypothetical protein n=1 Tax=Mycobacteroides abscessus TaxID=36809 RepID=UPI000C26A070|nr:hypothetical protein [Mycobacteroides abscessus]